MGEYKPMLGDISIYKYLSHIVRREKNKSYDLPAFSCGNGQAVFDEGG
jgi:hypothetical protein